MFADGRQDSPVFVRHGRATTATMKNRVPTDERDNGASDSKAAVDTTLPDSSMGSGTLITPLATFKTSPASAPSSLYSDACASPVVRVDVVVV